MILTAVKICLLTCSRVMFRYIKTHLSLHVDIELLDTLEGELFFLHQDANGVSHELLGHLQHLGWHGGREQNHLKRRHATVRPNGLKSCLDQEQGLCDAVQSVALHLEREASEH